MKMIAYVPKLCKGGMNMNERTVKARRRPSRLSDMDRLRAFAFFCMLIDHTAIYFLDGAAYTACRMIGRFAFPCFAFGLVYGTSVTSNLNRYRKRVFFLALVSQLPYAFLTGYFWTLNVCFLFYLFLAYRSKKYVRMAVFLAVCLLFDLVPEYGLAGFFLLVFLDRAMRKKKRPDYLASAALAAFLSLHEGMLAAIPFLFFPRIRPCGRSLSRKAVYGFYPAHLTVLFLFYLLSGGVSYG